MPITAITNSTAASLGLLGIYAMDMFTGMKDAPCLVPVPDPRLKTAGWRIVAYLSACDAIFHPVDDTDREHGLRCGAQVYYGYIVQSSPDSNDVVIVIRGTSGLIEWIEDAEFVPVPHPQLKGLTVEQGFWDIYDSMRLVKLDGSQLDGPVAGQILALVGTDARVTVVGHSLGSALATYLSLDLAHDPNGDRVSACLFASPRVGDAAFVQFFDQTVANYRLFNYVLDVVPRVPMGLGYSTLPKTTVLQPATAEASIRVDVGCNHHLICYCAMLDYENTPYQHATTIDTACAACILGPETASPTMAKLLADL